jgi:hypothetical protein
MFRSQVGAIQPIELPGNTFENQLAAETPSKLPNQGELPGLGDLPSLVLGAGGSRRQMAAVTIEDGRRDRVKSV